MSELSTFIEFINAERNPTPKVYGQYARKIEKDEGKKKKSDQTTPYYKILNGCSAVFPAEVEHG